MGPIHPVRVLDGNPVSRIDRSRAAAVTPLVALPRPRPGRRRAGIAAAAAAGWIAALGPVPAVGPAFGEASHGIAMHGEPALPQGFSRLRYAEPDAPKGGRITHGVLGTFDSLNPFIVKGLAPTQIRGYVIESLMARGYDEPFTLYGLLARSVETDTDRTYVTFTIDPAARFSDGKPVTAADAIFSWELLRDRGRPNFRTYYVKVAKAEALSERVVRFDLAGADDRELPLILGLMPILAKHAVDPNTFEDTTLEPILGSGPYVIAEIDAGRSVTLKRNPNYWGRDLAINRGFWNFDEVRTEFFRDANSHLEAFTKGVYDVRSEHDPSRWERAYDVPAVRDGRIVKEAFPTGLPKGLSALIFNTRRPAFADIRVREAIGLLLDFEWLNQNYFFGRYQRSASYFEDSELSARGRPASERERALLAPFPTAVRKDIMEGSWQPPVTDGSGRDRNTLKRALTLFDAAGYELAGTVLRSKATKQAFSFEFLVTTKEQERLALAFSRDLKRAGIAVRVRVVDAVQYDRRRIAYDYDMIEYRWDQSLSPGNEQLFYWSVASADQQGTRNYMGAKNPAVDAMIAALLKARERPDFIAAVRALDRVLMSGFYIVPLFHLQEQWVARWAAIEHPKETSLFGYLPETWWRRPAGAPANPQRKTP
ncbi:MAG: ABC transporter substrate-binding protein [Alphaproteobacteria bacterium]|nr:ABC transporter substrate-binding protein [Alphaproteobacteria bacterium]